MNWGNTLMVVFIAFAGLMAMLVYKAVTAKFELVTKDYYRDELRFQEQIDGAANAAAAGELSLIQSSSVISLQMPQALDSSTAEGEIWFYCKNDAAKDRKIFARIINGKCSFDRSMLQQGSYEMKLKIVTGNKHYYYSKKIAIEQ